MRAEVLQFQVAADEEAVRRYGEDYERSIKRQAYSALADMMIQNHVATETIIDPAARSAPDYDRYSMRRYYRFTVVVGEASQAQLAIDSVKQGRKEALDAIKFMLAQPNDYEGELRGYFLRWLNSVTLEDIAHVSAQKEPNP